MGFRTHAPAPEDRAERSSNVDAFDRGRIKRVIRFAETTVGEAMIPVADVTGIGRFLSSNDAQQSAFAAAIGANQAHPVAGIDIKSNVCEKRMKGEGFRELVYG